MKQLLFQLGAGPRLALAANDTTTTMFKRIVSGIFRHGRQVLEGVIKRPEPARELRRFTQLEVSQNRLLQSSWSGKKNLSVFGRFVTRYTSQCLAAELRRKAALQFQSGSFRIFGGASRVGKPLPLFAFLSVGLAAGVGIQSSEQDRYDPVCDHIKVSCMNHDANANGAQFELTTQLYTLGTGH